MIDWLRYRDQYLIDGDYLLCILGQKGTSSDLEPQYVIAHYSRWNFYYTLKDKSLKPLKEVIWYDKIVSLINVEKIKFDNPSLIFDELLVIKNQYYALGEFRKESNDCNIIDYADFDVKINFEELQNYCIIDQPEEEWIWGEL